MIATTGSLTPACTLLVVADNVATQSVILEHTKAKPRLFERTKRLEELSGQGELAEASSVCPDAEDCLTGVHVVLRELTAGGFPS